MKKYLSVALSLLLFACLFVNTAASGQKFVPAVPLRVTIEATDSTATACRICNDGLGEYVDGVDGVTASLTKNGYLSIGFQSRATLRTVNFDYFFPGNPSPPPVLPVVAPYVTSQVYQDFNLQDMVLGATRCIGLGWGYTNGDNITRNHGFQFGPHVGGSSYAIATCTAAASNGQCTQWTVEPRQDGVCNTNPSVAGVNDRIAARGKATDNDRGLYKMPFKLTINRK